MRRLLSGLGLMLLVTGCGAIRFNRAWSAYEPRECGSGSGMEGRWKGEWRSEWNGHSGGLRCLMTREEDGLYRAWFFSTYAGLLFFQYETLFVVTVEEAGLQCFEGQQDLGRAIGGVYRYEGRVEQESFVSTFRAENGDHGVFEMQRVD